MHRPQDSSNSSSEWSLSGELLSSSNSSCDGIPDNYFQANPIDGSWTLQNVMAVTAAPLTVLTTGVCLAIAVSHLANFTMPNQQRQLVRVLVVPAVFAIFSTIGLYFYRDSPYVVAIADFYESFALIGFFYYIISVVTPDENTRLEFFQQLEGKEERGNMKSVGSLDWFYKRWLNVFQLLPGRIITTIATFVVCGAICPFSSTQRIALLVINVINSAQTIICIISLINTYSRLRDYLQGHRVLAKAAIFKLLIIVQALQRPVFSGLLVHQILKPSNVISYMDWAIGIPDFATVCEAFLLCWIFIEPYSSSPFRPDQPVGGGGRRDTLARPAERRRSFAGALLDCLNPMDIFRGFFFTFRLSELAAAERIGEPAPPCRTVAQARVYGGA